MPTLTPIDGDPFADSLEGDVGAAMQKQQGDEAQRRNVVGHYLQHYTLPQRVMEGIHTETPGVLTEEDAHRFNQLQDEALNFGPHQALSMLASGLPRAEPGAVGTAGGKIKAYHGSPYDFDKFSTEHIGSGEGAQAYGHGLYFAENPAVAESYKQVGTKSAPIHYKGDSILAFPRDQFEALPETTRQALSFARMDANIDEAILNAKAYGRNDIASELKRLREMGELSDRPNSGKTYEVNINADPEHFLDWDKPLSEQHPKVQEAVVQNARKVGDPTMKAVSLRDAAAAIQGGGNLSSIRGDTAYQLLATDKKPATAAQALRQAGIPGIKYLDQGSRLDPERLRMEEANYAKWSKSDDPIDQLQASHALDRIQQLKNQKGTYNYVVFDDKLIDILKKYSMAGLTGTAGLMAAIKARQAQDNQNTLDRSGGLLMDKSSPFAPSMPGTGPETRQAPPPQTSRDIWDYWHQRGQAPTYEGDL